MLVTVPLGNLPLTWGLRFLISNIKRLECIALRPLYMWTAKLLRKLETSFLGDTKMGAQKELSSLD